MIKPPAQPLAIEGTVAPARKKRSWRPPTWLLVFTVPYIAVFVLLSISRQLGPERWFPTALNLYLPQWYWGAPAVILLVLCLLFARRWLWVPLAMLLWVAGPVMGLCLGTSERPPAGAPVLRVMTYNVKWASRDPGAVIAEIRDNKPDLVMMQDSAGALSAIHDAFRNWNVRESGQYLVASRFPLSPLESLDVSYPGSSHHAIRATILWNGTPVTIATAHLLTPRWALSEVRHRRFGALQTNSEERLIMGSRMEGYLREVRGPLIFAGDMNAPVETLVCQRFKDIGLRDAYAVAGRGYGYTYGKFTPVHRSYLRIDHVFASPHWGIIDSFVGTDSASDHCPVYADLFLKR